MNEQWRETQEDNFLLNPTLTPTSIRTELSHLAKGKRFRATYGSGDFLFPGQPTSSPKISGCGDFLIGLAFYISLSFICPPALAETYNPIALTIAGEACGEGRIGMRAVACVIANRAKIAHLSPEKVVSRGFYGKTNKVAVIGYKAHRTYIDGLVCQVKNGTLRDITFGATHFESVRFKKPWWAYKMKETCKIGRHIFYKEAK